MIHKKVLTTGRTKLKVPYDAVILDVQIQITSPVVWYMFDETLQADEIEVMIVCLRTGETLPDKPGFKYEYLATVQDGGLVYHYFMESEI